MERQGRERNCRKNSNGKGKKRRKGGKNSEGTAWKNAVNGQTVITVSPFLLQILLSCKTYCQPEGIIRTLL